MNHSVKPATIAELEKMVWRSAPPNFMFRAVQARVLDEITAISPQPKLVSIVAPVGYGKTVLMSTLFERLQHQGELCFWTALDDRDSSVQQVLRLLEEMIYRDDERLQPTQALFRGDAPIGLRIDRLLQTAANSPVPFTAFIDNLNNCIDEAMGHVLDRLVFETPPSVRFVFSSTAELPLNLVRAKLEGLIHQVGYTELNLTSNEVKELLGPELSSAIGWDGIETITQQTEGWPTAVRMVQIILAGSNNPLSELQQFSGSNEDLAALLNRRMFSGFSPEIREFLLSIAPLRTFSADLSRYATGCEEAEQYLATLLRCNAFIIPLDRNRTWYRLHLLFRGYLSREAQSLLSIAKRQEVLTRAAQWCERGGYWQEAIEYALMAGANETANGILEQTASNFVRDRGDLLQYISWVETLQQRGQPLGWESEYWYIWSLVLHRRYKDGRQQIKRLEKRIEHSLNEINESGQLHELHRRLEITKVCLDIFSDNLADAHCNATHWLEDTGEDDDPFDLTAAHCTQSLYFSTSFLFSEAREAAHYAQIAAFQTRNAVYPNGWIITLNALPSILEGNYSIIQPELKTALASLRANLGENSGISGTLALLAANCAVEMGCYEEGRTLLAQGLRTSQVHGVVDAIACGFDAALKLWTGENDKYISISELRTIAACYSPRAGFMLSSFLVRRLLRLGRLEDALTEASRIGLKIDSLAALSKSDTFVARSRDAYFSTAIALYIATGHARSAETLIVEETRRARADGRVARQVDLALAEAQLACQKGNPSAGNRHLTRAITLAATRGIIRPFDDHAATIAPLVENTKPTAWGFALAQERRFFAEICRRLPITDISVHEKMTAQNVESQLLDPLTKRQVELLALLDSGLSNQQIADRINVSLTTVKGHLQKLYAKLNVSSRSAALARARALNLGAL